MVLTLRERTGPAPQTVGGTLEKAVVSPDAKPRHGVGEHLPRTWAFGTLLVPGRRWECVPSQSQVRLPWAPLGSFCVPQGAHTLRGLSLPLPRAPCPHGEPPVRPSGRPWDSEASQGPVSSQAPNSGGPLFPTLSPGLACRDSSRPVLRSPPSPRGHSSGHPCSQPWWACQLPCPVLSAHLLFCPLEFKGWTRCPFPSPPSFSLLSLPQVTGTNTGPGESGRASCPPGRAGSHGQVWLGDSTRGVWPTGVQARIPASPSLPQPLPSSPACCKLTPRGRKSPPEPYLSSGHCPLVPRLESPAPHVPEQPCLA